MSLEIMYGLKNKIKSQMDTKHQLGFELWKSMTIPDASKNIGE